jgi:phosphoenolpyruvate-protein kinase (PTS system EI component)
MVADTLVEIAGKHGEHVQQLEILTTPITPEVAADLEALEGKRKQLLAESNKIFKVTASVLEDKMETERLYEQAKENEHLAEKELVRACRRMEDHSQRNPRGSEADAREAIRPRNINFDSAARPKPLATPKDNMKWRRSS